MTAGQHLSDSAMRYYRPIAPKPVPQQAFTEQHGAQGSQVQASVRSVHEPPTVQSIEQWINQVPSFDSRSQEPQEQQLEAGAIPEPHRPPQPHDLPITVIAKMRWTPKRDRTLLEAYREQQKRGCIEAHSRREMGSSWTSISAAFTRRHREWLTTPKLKYRINVLRRRWRAWVKLVDTVLESGGSKARYDRSNRLVRATDAWWDRYLLSEGNGEAKGFRNARFELYDLMKAAFSGKEPGYNVSHYETEDDASIDESYDSEDCSEVVGIVAYAVALHWRRQQDAHRRQLHRQ